MNVAKDQVSSRQEIFNAIEESRAAEVNAELEEIGSADRIEHDPTPEIRKAAGKDDGDEDAVVDDVADLDDKAGEDEKEIVEEKKEENKETIYDFLGEDKLDSTKVKIKVDGVEREVSIAELARGHQKNAAVDKRLEDAANARRQAETVLAEANTQAERIVQEAKDSSAASGDGRKKEAPSDKDALRQAGELLYQGDHEGFAEKIDAEINRRVEAARAGGATVDPAELAARIKTDLSWDAELSAFNRDHKDIAADPELARMFQRHLNEAAKTSTTPHEAIEAATEAVTGWLEKVSGKPLNDDADKGGLKVDREALRQRQADKAKQESVRSNSSIRSQSRAEPEEEYNPSKVVEEMKRARGQL